MTDESFALGAISDLRSASIVVVLDALDALDDLLLALLLRVHRPFDQHGLALLEHDLVRRLRARRRNNVRSHKCHVRASREKSGNRPQASVTPTAGKQPFPSASYCGKLPAGARATPSASADLDRRLGFPGRRPLAPNRDRRRSGRWGPPVARVSRTRAAPSGDRAPASHTREAWHSAWSCVVRLRASST